MTEKENNKISNRVKLLIKNLFANKESGWSKTKDINEGGPKTKAEVQNDVLDKYEKERQAAEEERKGGYQHRDNRYDNRGDRRNTNQNRRGANSPGKNAGGEQTRYVQKQKSENPDLGGQNQKQGGKLNKSLSYQEKRGNNKSGGKNNNQYVELSDDEFQKEVSGVIKKYLEFVEQD